MLTRLKNLLKKIPLVHAFGKWLKNFLMDLRVIPGFVQERRVKRQGYPIKVVFLCQYIPAWSKVEDLYRRMLEDDRFEPYLVCVPDGIMNNRLNDPESEENEAYDYCLAHGYTQAINARVGKDAWLDLRELAPAYVFYPRPYNARMPVCYTAREVYRYARVCLILYGAAWSDGITRVSLNRDFMSRTYFYFAELPFTRALNMRNNRLPHKLHLQKSECHGYPMFDHLRSFEGAESASWAFADEDFRILWTPRWTTELSFGGSNFFTYYRELVDYAAENTDVALLLRPHPLMFSHFIETGEMTPQEVKEYVGRCEALPNVSFDKLPTYEATFWNASVLVSDISSIMIEFFVTGKPQIFCASNMTLELSDAMKRMLEGCYIANNKQELFAHLQALKEGRDPLKELRQEIIREQFGDFSDDACTNILNALAQDFGERT